MNHGSNMEAIFPVDDQSMSRDHEDHDSLPPSGVSSGLLRRSKSFSGVDMSEEMRLEDEMSDDGGEPLGTKKKRLNLEQVRALERSFELANKLEPERKMQLAKALGLQPRQIAVWFQNRRARWKTKQLEKDYEVLKRQFEILKAHNELLRAQNKQFHSKLIALQNKELTTGKGPIDMNKENEACWSNGTENSIDVNLGTTGTISVESELFSNSHPTNTHMSFPSTKGEPSTHYCFHGSLEQDSQVPRIDQTTSDEGLCNMFNYIGEQPSYSPWSFPD